MKKIGIIGGIGPEATIIYYRELITKLNNNLSKDPYSTLIIESICMSQMFNFINNNDMNGLTKMINKSINNLEKGGAQVIAIASNTPHIVFERLSKLDRTHLINIVDETCKYISSKGFKNIGLIGTRSTMESGIYQKLEKKYNLNIVIPDAIDRTLIDQLYLNEIVKNNLNSETKQIIIQLINKLIISHKIEGLILGGTELSLLLKQDDFSNITLFDSTKIHIDSITKYSL
ncbi:aspartate/glutamate racemase family protein [Geojedonia litorea]|uniref:Aspartate/glutamate racemase family protein n=1 Tax=Geojedonia litorea TaxID=1268269 RepID=A0ABV9MXS4_9FLAO